MLTYAESDLVFTFPGDWVVRPFDQTRAFKSLSGHGLKGVDFIALTPAGELILIEVKNYHRRTKAGKTYGVKRPRPEELARRVARKFTDSLRLIGVVNQSLQRRRWVRFQLWWMKRRGADPRNNYWFWDRAYRLGQDLRNVRATLYLKTPERELDYEAAVEEHLMELLPKELRVVVTEPDGPLVGRAYGRGPFARPTSSE